MQRNNAQYCNGQHTVNTPVINNTLNTLLLHAINVVCASYTHISRHQYKHIMYHHQYHHHTPQWSSRRTHTGHAYTHVPIVNACHAQ
jgi:hypothetical protein